MRPILLGLLLLLVLAPAFPISASEPRFVTTWGKEGTEDGEFMIPIGIAISGQSLFVTDHYNNRIQKFDFDGNHQASFPVLPHPGGIGADKNGLLYLTHFPFSRLAGEKHPHRISVYRIDGTFARDFGKSGSGDGELNWPGGVTTGPGDDLYVADQSNHRVVVFSPTGKFLSKFGEHGNNPGQFGGSVTVGSRVGGPRFLAFDSQGNLYTTEAMGCRVQKLTRDGKPLTQWGSNRDEPGSFGGNFSGFKDKPVKMEGPIGIAIDTDDHVWVSSISGRIQQFDTDGRLLGGIQGGQGTNPGQFYAPHGIAISTGGDLFVVDSYNHRIQKFATK